MGGKVIAINSLDEFHKIINSDKPVFIDFWATWCGPCRQISPIFEQIAEKEDGKASFYKVDVDEQPDIAQEVGIRAMPSFVGYKNGQELDERVVGAIPPKLQQYITAHTA